MPKQSVWRRCRREEDGAVLVFTMMFLLFLFGLLSLLLLYEQAAVLGMRTQQTADLITKGARAAGKWTFVDAETGKKQTILFRTTSEARGRDANIIRGAREEAEILYKLNEPALHKMADRVYAVHQQGEQRWPYHAGIYHLVLTTEKKALLAWDHAKLVIRRVSQSGVYRN